MQDDQHHGAINRVSYEWCLLTTLRKGAVQGGMGERAHRYRNPDQDVPQDFDLRRDDYCAALAQPREATCLWGTCDRMAAALASLNAGLPGDVKVKIVTTKNGKGRIRLTPLEQQPKPANMVALTAALVHRWPMTSLLDMLKETELRVDFTRGVPHGPASGKC